MIRIIILFILAGCLYCCSGKSDNIESKPALSAHERDSILAASPIPGARSVKKAMSLADSASARAGRINSTADNNDQ